MSKTFTIATWNISEGHLARSADLFDYEHKENLDYFIHELQEIGPDIVCLQEINMTADGTRDIGVESLTSRIADALGFAYFHEAPMHHSLHDEQFTLGLGLVSSIKFDVRDVPLHQPDFPLLFASGTPATPHTRWLFVADFETFTLGTTHNWPMNIFQRSYDTDPGAGYGHYIDSKYLNELPSGKPLILAGDLNYNSPEKVTSQSVRKLSLHEALPQDESTMNDGSHPDHILYSPAFDCVEAKVIPGAGDHYLCYTKLRLK